MYDVIIIGGGCAGLTAALYAARSGLSVLVIEQESVGGQIASAPLVENFPAVRSISGAEFANGLFEQVMELGVDFELERVCRVENGEVKRVYTEYDLFEARALIIATGAKHRHLGLENEDRLLGHGVSYCAVCDGAFFKGGTAVVVGGGESAAGAVEFLAGLCEKVYLVHRRKLFRFADSLLERLKELVNVEIITDMSVSALIGEDKLEAVTLSDGSRLDTDALFVCVGQVPDNALFGGFAELDEDGYVMADEDCKSSADGVFAAGDCRTKALRQLVTAAADGAVAAQNALNYLRNQ